jgi:hypothetical protein
MGKPCVHVIQDTDSAENRQFTICLLTLNRSITHENIKI